MTIKIPRVVTTNKDLDTFQTQLAKSLQPLTSNPLLSGTFLINIPLSVGDNTFAHNLGRTPQGWFITDSNAPAEIYRSAPFNATNLTLNTTNGVDVNIWIF